MLFSSRRVFAIALAALLGAASFATSAQTLPDPCNIQTAERVVAIGDVHGAYEPFVAMLRAAGLTDGRGRWTGGRAVLVQTGDVVDRGPDSRRVLDLLRRLERDAARAGGAVHALLGNHEVMRMVGDWRYVSAGELAAFRGLDPDTVEARAFAMRQAFAANGTYGRWLRGRPTAVRINGVLYLHGGISPQTAPLGCAGINAAIRKELLAPPSAPAELAAMLASSEHGPLWYRGLAEEPEAAFAPALTAVLEQVGARAIVVGHTVADGMRIRTRFDGRVVMIDTGMLGGTFYPGGGPSALEIHGGSAAAVYLKSREPLTVAK